MHDPALFVFPEFGKHGQGENFSSGAFGLGEVAFAMSEVNETVLQVQRDRIVNFRADLTGVEEFAEFVAAVSADYILMKNRVCG